jgi:hypothetical protein
MVDLLLDEDLAWLYAGALYAIIRADGEVHRDENDHLRHLIARRWQLAIDAETLFFSGVTPESFAAAMQHRDPFRGSASGSPRQVAHALIGDAIKLAAVTGGLDEVKVESILRFSRALGYTTDDVRAATDKLAGWLDHAPA